MMLDRGFIGWAAVNPYAIIVGKEHASFYTARHQVFGK
jgi:hypothetical protein